NKQARYQFQSAIISILALQNLFREFLFEYRKRWRTSDSSQRCKDSFGIELALLEQPIQLIYVCALLCLDETDYPISSPESLFKKLQQVARQAFITSLNRFTGLSADMSGQFRGSCTQNVF